MPERTDARTAAHGVGSRHGFENLVRTADQIADQILSRFDLLVVIT